MVSYHHLFSLTLVAAVQCANSLPLQPSRHLEQTQRSLTVSSPVSIELVRRGNRVYICGWNKECSRQFDSVKRVEEHREQHKNNQLPATCTYCKQAYENIRGIGRHSCQPERSRQVAALKLLHRCDVKGCKGTFQTSEQLDAHKEDHITANIAANRANAGHKGLPFEWNFQGPKSPSPKSNASGSTNKRKAASPKSGSDAQPKFRKAPKAASDSPLKPASADRSRSQSSHPASVQSPSRSEVTRLGSQSNPRSKSKSPSPPDSQSNPPQGSRSKSESTSPGPPVSVPPKLDSPPPDGRGLSPLGTPKSSSPPLDGSGLSPLGTPKSTLDWPEPPSPDGELYKPQPMNSRPSSQSPLLYY